MNVHPLIPKRSKERQSWQLRPQSLRKLHTYCAALSAPMLLFLTISGMLQLFDFHKARPDTGYRPAPLLQAIGTLHKNQTIDLSRGSDDASGAKPRKHDSIVGVGQHARTRNATTPKTLTMGQLLLKWYAVMASLTFIATMLAGLYMSIRLRSDKKTVLGLFAAGFVIPLAILFLIP